MRFIICINVLHIHTYRKATISFVMSARPHGTTRFPLTDFKEILIFGAFFENLSRKFKFDENPTRIKGTYMKTYIHLFYLVQFFLELEVFQTKVVENIKTLFILNKFFPKIVAFTR
jgi:hypothetical protein